MSTTPWKPADKLNIPDTLRKKYLSGYRGRFVRTANVYTKLQEGWQKVDLTSEEVKLIQSMTMEHGTPMGSHLQRGELILMRMPEEMAKSRQKYFEELTNIGVQGQISESAKEAAKSGNTVYSEFKESK